MKCNETRLGIDANKDCTNLKQSIINVTNNNAIYDRDKAISNGLDPNSTGVKAINDFINKNVYDIINVRWWLYESK